MQPRLTIHNSAATSSTIGNAMTLPEPCSIEQVFNHAGAPGGVRFIKKKSPPAPCGYRFITIARSRRCGTSNGATSA